MTSDGWTTLKLNDPPQLSPYNYPLNAGATPAYAAPAPTPAATARPASPEPSPGRDVRIQQRLDAPAPGPLKAPRLPEIAAGDQLKLEVDAPATAATGETISFRIVLSNPTATAADNVVVECGFGDGLEFPGSGDRKVRQPLGRLEAGASRSLTLALTAVQAGRHCAAFTATSDNFATATRDACVTCQAAPVEVSIAGPATRYVGNRAEYVITLLNRSGRVVPNARMQIEHPATLIAKEASAGVVRNAGRLEWDLDALQIDERVQIQVEFECGTAADAACVQFRLESAAGSQQRETCLQVLPQPDPLIVSLTDGSDPANAGEEFEYRLEIGNGGGGRLDGVGLLIDIPESIQVGAVTVREGIQSVAVQPSRRGNQLSFPRLPALSPNRSFVITIPATPTREGLYELSASIEPPGGPACRIAEITVVNPRVSGASRASHSRGR